MAILTPRLHQQELMDFHLNSKMMGSLAWHGMGLGKTLASLWLARKLMKDLREQGIANPKFLVIVPKSAVPTWKVECSKHTPDIFSNMILVPYSQLHNLKVRIKYADVRMIVFDESHYLKTPGTNRIDALADVLVEVATVNGKFDQGRTFCLSGTPMPNGAFELYTTWCLCTSPNLIEAASRIRDDERFNNWKETFSQRKERVFLEYNPKTQRKEERKGSSHKGVANEDMLNQLLQEFVHFRRVSDCIDLPETVCNYIDLNLPDDKLLADANIDEPEAYMALQERLSRAKTPYMMDWVRDFIAAGDEQLVVFSNYTEPLKELRDRFKKHVRIIIGSEDAESRAKNLADFQSGAARVLVMSYQCGAESLNLQNAYHSLYHGYPWTDGKLKQAMARTARQGQKNTTFHNFLTSGYNDQSILGIVRSKEAATTTVEDLLLGNTGAVQPVVVDPFKGFGSIVINSLDSLL